MNTETGQIYEVGEDFNSAFRAELAEQKAMLERRVEERLSTLIGRELLEDERAMIQATQAGETVVEVSPLVAQTQKLGQRELERRQRRRDVKAARRRNRS